LSGVGDEDLYSVAVAGVVEQRRCPVGYVGVYVH